MSDYNELKKWNKSKKVIGRNANFVLLVSYFGFTGSEHEQYIDSHGDGLPMYELMNFYNGSWHTVMEYVTSR